MIFAVIDIEWVGGPLGNIVQLGGIMYDEYFNEKRRFYRIVKPCKYKEEDLAFMNLGKEDVESGVDINTAACEFRKWLGNCRKIVVWSEQTRVQLEKLLRRYATYHYARTTALQEEYKSFLGTRSFCRICECYNIPVNKQMHISINDCEYLGALYKILWNTPSSELKNTVKRSVKKAKYHVLKNSTIYHDNNCRYIKERLRMDKLPIVNSIHADVLGLKPCKCCNPEQAELIPVPPVEWYEEDVEKFCEALNLRCEIYFNTIHIHSDISTWYFRRNTSKVKLNHQNLYANHNGHHKFKHDYHDQNLIFSDPMDAIWYIYKHDKYKFSHQEGGCYERIS